MQRPFALALVSFGLGLIVGLLSLAPQAEATEYVVDANGHGDYTFIQPALENASLGDTIYVWNGTYNEYLIVNQSVSLIGNGSEAVTINGSGIFEALMTVTADNVDITGFNLSQGSVGLSAIRVEHLYLDDIISVDRSNEGLKFEMVDHCTVTDITLVDNRYGIRMVDTNHCTVSDAFIWDNHWTGVELYNVTNFIFEDAFVLENDEGVKIDLSDNLSFDRVDVEDHFELKDSTGLVLKRVSLDDGIDIQGDKLEHWNTHTMRPDSNNFVADRPLMYLPNWDWDNIPAGGGQIIVANSTNVTVEDMEVSYFPSDNAAFLTVAFSSLVLIQDNLFTNMEMPIKMVHSHNSTIQNNDLYYNEQAAIWSEFNLDLEILNNRLLVGSDSVGILDLAGFKNLIAGNQLVGNNSAYGIAVVNDEDAKPTVASRQADLIKNYASGFGYGLYVHGTEYVRVNENHVTDSYVAILAVESSDLSMTHNLVENSSYLGVYLEDLIDPKIQFNRFICLCEGNVLNEDDNWYNATNNWWGNLTGPYNQTRNPNGSLPEVHGNVTFRPWYTQPLIFHTRALNATYSEREAVVLEAQAMGITPLLRYVWSSDLDGEFYNDTEATIVVEGLSNGTHTLSLQILDELGFWSSVATTEVTIEGVPRPHKPQLPILAVFRGQDLQIDLAGHDFEDDLTDLEVELHYRPQSENLSSDWLSPLAFNSTEGKWQTTMTPPLNATLGRYDLHLTFTDTTGHRSETLVCVNAFQVLNNLPEASWVGITPNPVLDTAFFKLEGTGTDAESNIVRYLWRTENQTLYEGPNDHYSFQGLAVGTHTLFLKVQDSDGSWSSEVHRELVVGSRPVVEVEAWPALDLMDDVQVTFYGNQTTGRSLVKYVWTSELSGELYNGTKATFKTNLSVGNHHIFLRVQDDQGFWSQATYIDAMKVDAKTKIIDDDEDTNGLKAAWPVFILGIIAIVVVLVMWKRSQDSG